MVPAVYSFWVCLLYIRLVVVGAQSSSLKLKLDWLLLLPLPLFMSIRMAVSVDYLVSPLKERGVEGFTVVQVNAESCPLLVCGWRYVARGKEPLYSLFPCFWEHPRFIRPAFIHTIQLGQRLLVAIFAINHLACRSLGNKQTRPCNALQ